jgi:glycosyltransferase involved in cell wall biosynthesis
MEKSTSLSLHSPVTVSARKMVHRSIDHGGVSIAMTTLLKRVAFVGNSLPRRCGIATFTTDLQQAVAKSRVDLDTVIVAMTDHAHTYEYPAEVRWQIKDQDLTEYARAAEFLNLGKYQLVCLQHEFGIFGGEAGNHVIALLSRLTMPVVTTLHTVLAEPSYIQRTVLKKIVDVSSSVIVMADKARHLLRTVYDIPADKIEVIPHGIPDFDFVEPDLAKAKLGFAGKTIILTFGLLSPNKGIEIMIDAMPSILKSCPDALYVVLGATHPNLMRSEGEAYRDRLVERTFTLGVEDNVVFLNRFVDQATLLDFIAMCDVYVTPYLNEAQMTSGTLAYSFGLGKAVVSTPYWHAQELLANGGGVLVPFGDARAIGGEIAGLLSDDRRRDAMRERAYTSSRSMTWEHTADRYLSIFEKAVLTHPLKRIARRIESVILPDSESVPSMQLSHLLSMCDDTGLLQHAVCSVPDRAHGYCIDDNARALLVACALNAPGEKRLPETLTSRFAAFVQHAWNPERKRFRNFMSFERRWLEECGSEDSHGRTLWALGECARSDANDSRRQWATCLFAEGLTAAARFDSPRAWAFTLLGLDAYCQKVPENSYVQSLRPLLADKLMSILSSVETNDWVWFEEGLSYDNARLPQALIVTGHTIGSASYIAAGLRTLRWLMTQQTSEEGVFRPIGTDSFGDKRAAPRAFDQQPLEAAASISACIAAWHMDGDARWKDDAARAFAWFLGNNDLLSPLVDAETGSCRDGLHPDRTNENRGGESAVSYLLSVAEIRQFSLAVRNREKPGMVLALSA